MLARLIVPVVAVAIFAPSALASDGNSPREVLDRSAAALDGRGDGREITPLLKELAVALPKLDRADRAEARRLLARPTPGEGAGGSDQEYTVPEHAPPHCTEHFCVHWVDSTADAPPLEDQDADGVPDYVETTGLVFEQTYQHENVQLGWRAPVSDGARGCPGAAGFCLNRTDVYLKDVGGRQVYGFAAPDPGQRSFQQHAFLVIDNDFAARQFRQYGGNSLPPMQVTAAHEYNHVLQFAYDIAQDTWMFESTATWMEDEVFTEVDDYRQYIEIWANFTDAPMTSPVSSGGAVGQKPYAANVWNRWLDTKFGPDVIRNAWELSRRTATKSFAPAAYDGALRSRGSSFAEAFAQFTADTAEWRSSNSPFEEGSAFPDVDRAGNVSLRPGEFGAGGMLDHTGYFLVDVPPTDVERLKLVFEMASGPAAALALVGREGDETSGTMSSVVKRLRRGGTGVVVLDEPGRFDRITAMVANADIAQRGFSRLTGDWIWRNDRQPFRVRVSTDFTSPGLVSRSPGAGRTGVSRRTRVKVRFSERMSRATPATVRLVGPGDTRVKAGVRLSGGRTLTVTPRRRLRRGVVYRVSLSPAVRDLGGNKLPASVRSWRFRTAR